jgi:hypothetical protein
LTKLSTTYFGPVQWYQKLYRSDRVWIEACETFQKQTYRNRCIIATTNGPQTLSVPIEHAAANQPISTIRISNHGKWRTEHWNALQSAYGESPFFDYYADDLRPFFHDHWDTLFQFNLDIIQKMCELLDIHPHIQLTTTYKAPAAIDLRDAIRPKNPLPDADFKPLPYYQVYQQKHGFLPNLSILDLLFNMGNESIFYL